MIPHDLPLEGIRSKKKSKAKGKSGRSRERSGRAIPKTAGSLKEAHPRNHPVQLPRVNRVRPKQNRVISSERIVSLNWASACELGANLLETARRSCGPQKVKCNVHPTEGRKPATNGIEQCQPIGYRLRSGCHVSVLLLHDGLWARGCSRELWAGECWWPVRRLCKSGPKKAIVGAERKLCCKSETLC